ncbi:MAG: manganese-binding transcriptional regulator MntR, partial [Planctomycetota bacterium]
MEHHVGDESLQVFRTYIQSSARRTSPGASPPSAPLQRAGEDAPPDRFQRVREAHATELVEDYVEAIGDLIRDRGQARVADLARHFGVSHVTVSRTTGRLQRDGYITTEPYRPILLTPKGRDLAHRSRERHRIVLAFFLWLGVPPKAAEIDAEGVEHHVCDETLARMATLSSVDGPPS